MGYELEKFTNYIEREQQVLTAKLFSGGDTAKFARVQRGVKGTIELPHLSSTANLQAGSCVAPSGTVTGDLISLTVKPFTNYKSFCGDELETKFPSMELAPGSYSESNGSKAWEEALIDTEIASVQEFLELMYWQGDTTGQDLNIFDGFIKKIDAESSVIDGNTSNATTISKANVKELVEDMRNAAPAKVKRSKAFTIVVGDDVFDMYIQAEKADNLYHFEPEHNEGVYRIGGSGATLMRVYGLDGTDRMFAGDGYNFILGNDGEKDSETVEMFFDQNTRKTNIRTMGKAGVAIANPSEIVEFTLGI